MTAEEYEAAKQSIQSLEQSLAEGHANMWNRPMFAAANMEYKRAELIRLRALVFTYEQDQLRRTDADTE